LGGDSTLVVGLLTPHVPPQSITMMRSVDNPPDAFMRLALFAAVISIDPGLPGVKT
jgi:hypothetical protein